MEQIIAFAGVISVITVALVQVLKKLNMTPKNWLPVAGMIIGVIIGGVSLFIPEIITELSLGGRLLAGLISGLMATGLWETFKNREGKNVNKLGAVSESKAPKK
ncbi:holin [Staphylococcus equorum]|uniref:holin n=1 Tax=Staphylococcus equorum TaxID=246432 RepID=UPI0025550306|nr:holin [Staphylococcus equorum]MDK9857645.1 holin [Staphylococcus equorum]MDK9874706.1 holin [Staphylococcus equorum]